MEYLCQPPEDKFWVFIYTFGSKSIKYRDLNFSKEDLVNSKTQVST